VKRQIALLAIAIFFALPSFAQIRSDALPPSVPGNVTLSLDEYNRLLALTNRPGKKSEMPPVPYVLKHAEVKLRVVDDDVLGSIQFDGETLGTNATKVPLVTGMTILDARHGAKPLPLLVENGTHTAILSGESEFAVSLDAGLPVAIEAGRASFALPIPSAGSVRLTLSVPGERTNVQLNHGIITHRASVGGNTEIEATLVSVTESDLQIAALADLNVVQGEAEQFSVAVPEGFEVTAVNGPTLESSEVVNGVLNLRVAGHGPGTHQFLISYERPISDSKAASPILTFKDAQRETGEVLVEGQGTLELTAKESGGLKRLDIKEVNPYLRALSRYSLQTAFRYHRQPSENPAPALEWTRFPDSSVLAAIAERATVTTLVTSEGKSLTEVKLTIKNQAQPFLKVELPAGASILTAEVSGEKVKPVQGTDGNRVPLLRAGFRPAGAYTVSFVFLHAGTPFAKKGDSNISLPKMDVPIGVLEWELFLPVQFKVKDFSGDAIAAALVPGESDLYATGQGSGFASGTFQAGVGVGSGTGGGVAGGVVAGLSLNGRNFEGLSTLAPGLALSRNQLGGYVFEPSGAVIPNARVEIQSLATQATWNVETSSEGSWLVLGVPSGTYQITATAPGFKSTRSTVTYNEVNPSAYRISLNLAAATETVMVEAEAPVLNTTSSSISSKDKKHKVAAPPPPLPTASANVFNLQQRIAGVLPIAVDVPRAGTSYRFIRPLVVNEETKLAFNYKTK
jgi:carboxypeptidase family protein